MAASSSSSSFTPKKIALITSDGERFDVNESTILKSQTIKNMIDDNCADSEIPLPNITGEVFCKVIEYCKKKEEEEGKEENQTSFYHSSSNDSLLANWEAEFVKFDGNQGMLFGLIHAANYLDIKGLLDLTCKTVAYMMSGKSPEEIRKIFHIVNDYTKEEEEEVRRENQWAFD